MSDQQLPVVRVLEFKTEYVMRNGQPVARDWVKYAPRHNIHAETWEIVKTITPPESGFEDDDDGTKMAYMSALWSQVGPAYEAWKKGLEMPEDGTPLAAWSGLSVEQAKVFRASGIKTVEEIRDMTDNQLGKIMLPGVRTIKKMATEFLGSKDKTESAARVAGLEEQNAVMSAQLQEMAAMIAEMRNRPAVTDDDGEEEDAPRRGRGRPRKAEAA